MFDNITLTGFADEMAKGLNEQTEGLKKLGMSHIEMRNVEGKNITAYDLDEVKQIKSRLDEEGISISAVGSGIGKIGIKDDFANHMELFKHTVEVAHILKTPNIRIFSFYIPKGEDLCQYRDQVLWRLGQLADYAADNEVILLHENEKGIYGEMADGCLDIMNNFYSDHFKAVFDFANFVQVHQAPLAAYELLKPYIAYIHVKDARWSDGEVVPAGYGDGSVKEILKLLLDSGYQGFLSLEPHLAEFTGFTDLEKGGALGKLFSDEDSFTLAYTSLIKLLEEIQANY